MTSSDMIKLAGDLLQGIVDCSNYSSSSKEEKAANDWKYGEIKIDDSSKEYIRITTKIRALARILHEKSSQSSSEKEKRDIKLVLNLLEEHEIVSCDNKSGSATWNITLKFNQTEINEITKKLPSKLQSKKGTSAPSSKPQLPPRVYNPKYWVERSSLTNDLRVKLESDHRLLLLVGISGIGKTAQAERLVEKLRESRSWTEVPCNCENDSHCSFTDLAIACLAKSKIPIDPHPDALLAALVQQLTQHPYLILIDSAEYLLNDKAEFREPLWLKLFTRILSAESCQSRLLITSQNEMLELNSSGERYRQIWHRQIVRGWQESEQIKFFQSHDLEPKIDKLKEPSHPLRIIGRVYDGHPLVLEIICGEIKDKYHGSVGLYWKDNSKYVETVAKEIEEARNTSLAHQAQDHWRLHDYTTVLESIIHRRLGLTLQRLQEDAELAHKLLCLASQYRIEVAEECWLLELKIRNYVDEQANRQALEILQNRYLIKSQIVSVESRDQQGEIQTEPEMRLSLHNLIRSLAIVQRTKLFDQ
jgi:DNA polymerase III delta prime subunit